MRSGLFCVWFIIGQLLERPTYPGVDLVLSGEAHDERAAASLVGYVEGFATTCAVGYATTTG